MQGRSIPMAPGGSPVCCGSDTLTADSQLSSTGNFSRSAVGGAFQVRWATGGWITDNVVGQVTVDISGDDITPPSKVVDLSGMFVNPDPAKDNSFKLSFTAPGDDLDSQDPVKNYIIKYSQNLTAQNFDSGILLTTKDLVAGSSLTPVDGGQLVEITIK